MTPAARVQAAIGVLDQVASGMAAEKALTNWARGARYAGSKDRAAVRDHVFDVLRQWRSCAALGGGQNGRALMLGLLRQAGAEPEALFSGQGHGPVTLSQDEQLAGRPPQGHEAWDMPDWLAERLIQSLGDAAENTALALRHRAPVFLRVNTLKADLAQARASLAQDGIETRAHPLCATALEVTEGARALSRSAAYTDGLVELQDAASQAVVEALPLHEGMRVLDYCAGGGGKALAMAARVKGPVEAHDADPRRMGDLPQRALRAGADIRQVSAPRGPYDLVLADVPCSGSGAWRRAPEGKWRLTPDGLAALCALQAEILEDCAALVAPGGTLAYATCSLLTEENAAQADRFASLHPDWKAGPRRQFLPSDGADGLFVACFTRT